MTTLNPQHKHISQAFAAIISLCVILLLGTSIIQAQDAPSASNFDPFTSYTNLDAIKAQANKVGNVRVIVGLSQTTTPSSTTMSSPQTLTTVAANVMTAQNVLLSTLTEQNVRSIQQFRYIPYIAMTVDAPALDALSTSPWVASISSDAIYRTTVNYSMQKVGAAGDSGAHAMGITGKGWAVAVLDTGVDKAHPALKGRIVAEACFSTTNPGDNTSSLCPGSADFSAASDSGKDCSPNLYGCGHGTHVAGIIASSNRVYTGMAPRANIIAINVFSRWQSHYCYPDTSCVMAYGSDIISGLEHVLDLQTNHGINVAAVNLSLAAGKHYSSRSTCDAANPGFKSVIDTLRNAGIATVAASGNDSELDGLNVPACISGAVSVGATNDNDQIAPWSNTAYYLDLLAPGVDIKSAKNQTKTYIASSGTSMAAPHVAGAWALLREAKPQASVLEVLNALQMSGEMVADTRNSLTTRHKYRIQVDRAVESLLGRSVYTPTEPQNLSILGYSETTLTLNWDDARGEAGYRIERTPHGAGAWETVGWAKIDSIQYVDIDLNCETAYEYQVVAYNLSGDSSPSISNYAVTTTCTGRELLKNRHFEVNMDANHAVPDDWQASGNLAGDKVLQDGVYDYSHDGSNAFQFSGGLNVSGVIIQSLDLNMVTFNAGDSLQLSGYVDRRSAPADTPIGRLIVTYSDNKSRQIALKLPKTATKSGVYKYVSTIPMTLTRTDIKKVTVQFYYKQSKGKFMMDNVSLWQSYGENMATVESRRIVNGSDLLNLPAAPADLRGN